MWTRRFYIILSIVPLLAGLAGFLALLQTPYVGMKFESKHGIWYIDAIAAGSPAEQLRDHIGDEVVAVNGLTIHKYSLLKAWNEPSTDESFQQWSDAQNYFSENIRPGAPVKFTLRRQDGKLTNIELIPTPTSFGQVFRTIYLNYIIACASLLIALFIAVKKPDDITVKVFFFLTVCLSIIIFTFISWSHRDIALNIRLFGILLAAELLTLEYFAAFFLHFTLVFPTEKRIARNKVFLVALYLIPLLVFLLSTTRGPLHVMAGRVPIAAFTAGFLAGIAVMIVTYFRLTAPEEKAQIKWVFWAILLVILLMLVLTDLPMLAKSVNYFNHDINLLISILIPLSLAFSIMKYRLMDIDTIFDNTIIYVLTLGALALIDVGAISFLIRLQVLDLVANPFFSTAVLVWMVIFTYIPVRDRIKAMVKRVLKRELYNINDVSMQLSVRLLSLNTTTEVIAQAEGMIMATLHPHGIRTVLYDTDLPMEHDRGGYLKTETLKTVTQPTPFYAVRTEEPLPSDATGGVIVPLIASRGALGCMLLKNKRSDNLYSSEDLQLLQIISSQTAMAMENIQTRERAQRQEKAAREEKERIAREIHDGIATEFAGILAYSEKGAGQLARGANPEDIAALLVRIEDAARTGMRELRSIIWAVGPDYEAARFLFPYIKRYTNDLLSTVGIDLTVTQEGLSNGVVLSPNLRLAIMRIIQEACHNIMKHSDATEAEITFRAEDGQLELTIEDNGKGFDPAAVSDGNGLRNIRKRAEESGGNLTFESIQEKGTKIRVALPFQNTQFRGC